LSIQKKKTLETRKTSYQTRNSGSSIFFSERNRKTADIIFASEQESICGNQSEPVREIRHCVTKYVTDLRQQAAALYVLETWGIRFDKI
jgi:hypothetical protein